MAGAIIGGVISAIPAIMKLTQSGKDRKLGEGYLDTPRPPFKTPDEIFRAQKRLQMLSGQPLPGKGYIEEELEATTSGGIRALQESQRPSEAMGGILDLYKSQMSQKRMLGIQEAVDRRGLQKELAAFETDVLAPYKLQEFDINLFQPYQQAQTAAAALLRSSELNRFGGVEGLSAIGVTLAGQIGSNKTTTTDGVAAQLDFSKPYSEFSSTYLDSD